MQFRIQVPILTSNRLIDYNSKLLSLGSCFAVNIAEKLSYHKFSNTVNPFGILFNPVAIETVVTDSIDGKTYGESDIFEYNGLWHSYDVHSELSSPDGITIMNRLNRVSSDLRNAIADATHIIITLGTAWVYRHNSSGKYVANCHKVPQKEFTKQLLGIAEIFQSLTNITALIRTVNPDCSVILTVSPVRHIKDGFERNQRSKAQLISAIHDFISHNATVSYFPSYEIMIDELRDYRFYADDMLHPSDLAIEYIWKRFAETQISDAAIETMAEVESIQKALHHRPFDTDSNRHRLFAEKLRSRIHAFEQSHPGIRF